MPETTASEGCFSKIILHKINLGRYLVSALLIFSTAGGCLWLTGIMISEASTSRPNVFILFHPVLNTVRFAMDAAMMPFQP
jgi:hypothetical protein